MSDTYRCWAEIDRSALRHNAGIVRERQSGPAHDEAVERRQSAAGRIEKRRYFREQFPDAARLDSNGWHRPRRHCGAGS